MSCSVKKTVFAKVALEHCRLNSLLKRQVDDSAHTALPFTGRASASSCRIRPTRTSRIRTISAWWRVSSPSLISIPNGVPVHGFSVPTRTLGVGIRSE